VVVEEKEASLEKVQEVEIVEIVENEKIT